MHLHAYPRARAAVQRIICCQCRTTMVATLTHASVVWALATACRMQVHEAAQDNGVSMARRPIARGRSPCGMRARTSPSFFRLQPLLRVTGVAYVWSVLDRQNLAPFAEDLGRLFRSLF
jgi:hypothetical protein